MTAVSRKSSSDRPAKEDSVGIKTNVPIRGEVRPLWMKKKRNLGSGRSEEEAEAPKLLLTLRNQTILGQGGYGAIGLVFPPPKKGKALMLTCSTRVRKNAKKPFLPFPSTQVPPPFGSSPFSRISPNTAARWLATGRWPLCCNSKLHLGNPLAKRFAKPRIRRIVIVDLPSDGPVSRRMHVRQDCQGVVTCLSLSDWVRLPRLDMGGPPSLAIYFQVCGVPDPAPCLSVDWLMLRHQQGKKRIQFFHPLNPNKYSVILMSKAPWQSSRKDTLLRSISDTQGTQGLHVP